MIRIEPYTDKEVKSVLKNLLEDKAFVKFIKTNLNSSTSQFLSIPGSSFLVMQLFKSKMKKSIGAMAATTTRTEESKAPEAK